jgi:hypothetical protein
MKAGTLSRGTPKTKPDMEKKSAWINVLLLFAVLLPGIASASILYKHAFSVPYQDDYHAILGFAAKYQQLPTWQQRMLAIVVERHNEYKLVLHHSIIAAELKMTGRLNLRFLCALGNLSLWPLAFFLWLTYQDASKDLTSRLIHFIPISFIFFALTYWETLDWAMSSLQNIPVILFSLMTLYLITPRKGVSWSGSRLVLGCVFAALSSFTSANGFLLAPIGLLIFLHRRAYGWASLWCISFILPLGAYLYGFVVFPRPPANYTYFYRVLFFLGDLLPVPAADVVIGLLIVFILGLALRSRFDRINPVAVYFSLWIVATACLVAWERSTMGSSGVSRYSVYCSLLLIFSYSYLTHRLSTGSSAVTRRIFYSLMLVSATVFCLAADYHAYRKLEERRRQIFDGIEFYRLNPEVNSPMNEPDFARGAPEQPAYARDALNAAIHQGIYSLEESSSH